MRLIDADRLSEVIYDNVSALYEDAVCAKEDCLAEIESAQAVDAVPVVRCRECVGRAFWEKDHNDVPVCLLSGLYVKSENDFCSYGERKEGADNGS